MNKFLIDKKISIHLLTIYLLLIYFFGKLF